MLLDQMNQIEFIRTNIKSVEKKISRGRLWIEPKYYNESNIIIHKNPEFINEYYALTKWIKKKYHIKK